MNAHASISIAMATYNGEAYLRQQLDSIAAQTELPAEIVISDDGSNDATISIAERFGRDAPFDVRVLPPHDRLGFGDNFLHAAENCRSPLIMFCDQDDIWVPEKLARSRERLLHDDSLMLLHTLALVDANDRPVGVFTQGIEHDRRYGPLEIEPYLCGHGNTMMFRRELLTLAPRSARPRVEDGRLLAHDTWLYTLAAGLGCVSHLTQNLVQYRQHGENVSSLDHRGLGRRFRDLLTFAMGHHERQAAFNSRIAEIFEEIARDNPDWKDRALVAAALYRERADAVRQRVDTYSSPSLAGRVRAFRSLRRSRSGLPGSRKAKLLAETKDFLLGVGRLGFRL